MNGVDYVMLSLLTLHFDFLDEKKEYNKMRSNWGHSKINIYKISLIKKKELIKFQCVGFKK